MRTTLAIILLFAASTTQAQDDEAIASLEELAAGFQQVTVLVQECLDQDELDCTNLLEAAGQIGAAFNAASAQVCSTDRRSLGYRRSRSGLSCSVAGFGIWSYTDSMGADLGFQTGEARTSWSNTLTEGVVEVIDQSIRDAMERARVTVEEVQ